MTDILSLSGVTKRYGAFTAVDDLSFAVRPGEVYGFLGQNGAGKTTTLRMVMDIVPPSAGRVTVLGSDRPRSVRRRVGYLPEERGLYKKMKAADSVAYFARLKGVPAHEAKRRALTLLDRFGLAEFATSKVEALSKGMAQKVQLAAVVAHEPELLILDEPFSGLDPVNQQALERVIDELRDQGRTIVFSTHVMEHAERLCDRFLMVARGRKVFEGTLADARAERGQRLSLQTPAEAGRLAGLPGVAHVEASGPGTYLLTLAEGADRQAILRALVERGVPVEGFGEARLSLHDLFFELAGAPAAGTVQKEAA
jgi:ABC-2 type transport system ATP-binding protein